MNIKSTILTLMAAAAMASSASAADISMTKGLTAFYEPVTSDVANYYVAVSDNETALYNSSTGVVSMTGAGYIMALDLYGTVSDTKPIRIPSGDYKEGDGSNAFTYYADPEVSYLMQYNKLGAAVASYPISGTVNVTVDAGGSYTITATAKVGDKDMTVEYVGQIGFDNTEETPFVWPQLRQDINCDFVDAVAVYDGNLYKSNTGAFYLSLSDGQLNPENGTIATPNSTRVAIMLFDILFHDSSTAYVMPGTYSMARNFRRKTWYPGLEVDYMGMTIPFGTYAQKHCPDTYPDSDFGYSYVTDGTIEIKRDDNGVYDITVDCLTSYGHVVKGTYHGEIPVIDESSGNTGPATISTLEHDVVCDLEQIPVARLQYNGMAGNPTECHSLVLDIGSPSGKDQALVDNGGDIMRFELLQSPGQPYLVEGTYTVTEDKWENYYAPFGLVQGHFSKTANGDLTGTRYMHFIEGRYLVMDHLAPAMEGTLGVTKNDDGTWTFKFSLVDDAYFMIDGEWTGPVEYTYDPAAIMASTISAEAGTASPELRHIDADHVQITGLPDGVFPTVFNMAGSPVSVAVASDGTISFDGLNAGVYVISAAGKSFKIIR